MKKAVLGLVAGFALLAPTAALAQTFTPDPVDEAAAKREGVVNWYTSTPVTSAQRLANRFRELTGIRVELFRSGGSQVLRRFLQEVQARHAGADVVTMSDASAAIGLTKRGLFEPFKPVDFDKISPEAKDADGYWIGHRLSLITIMLRSDKVPEENRPKAWIDLTKPKYKGMMVMPDPSFTSIQLIAVGTLSQKFGWGFYEKLRANDIMIVRGHQQMFDTIKQGERIISAEGGDPRGFTDGVEVSNVIAVTPTEGAIYAPSPTAVVKGARQPNAAKLFAQFLITKEAQQEMLSLGLYSVRVDMPPPAGSPPLSEINSIPVPYDFIEKNERQLKDRFNDIFH